MQDTSGCVYQAVSKDDLTRDFSDLIIICVLATESQENDIVRALVFTPLI